MRHYDTSCGSISCVPMRKDGVPEFVIKALYYREWYSDTISEMTALVISLMVSIYHCMTYRALITNSGTPSFLVGMQDIGPHMSYHNKIIVSFKSQSCLHFLLYNPYIPFLIA